MGYAGNRIALYEGYIIYIQSTRYSCPEEFIPHIDARDNDNNKSKLVPRGTSLNCAYNFRCHDDWQLHQF